MSSNEYNKQGIIIHALEELKKKKDYAASSCLELGGVVVGGGGAAALATSTTTPRQQGPSPSTATAMIKLAEEGDTMTTPSADVKVTTQQQQQSTTTASVASLPASSSSSNDQDVEMVEKSAALVLCPASAAYAKMRGGELVAMAMSNKDNDGNQSSIMATAKSILVLLGGSSDTWSTLAGIVAFGSTLAASTWVQQRILRISTGSMPPLPTLVGTATVCMGSLAAHNAALATNDWCHAQPWTRHRRRPFANPFDDDALATSAYYIGRSRRRWEDQDATLSLFSGRMQIPLHTIRICALGLIAFKLLGGRFWAIAPSSYSNLGSYAQSSWWKGGSLPATARYATASERLTLERLGRRHGCHTCGSRKLFAWVWQRKRPQLLGASAKATFVGDHMPPKSVAEVWNQKFYRRWWLGPVKYRFYPQCLDCSSKQGSLLAKATIHLRNAHGGGKHRWRRLPNKLAGAGGGANSYFHGLQPRLNHLAGGAVAAVTVMGATSSDLADGNRRRFAQIQTSTIKWVAQSYANASARLTAWEKNR